MNLYMWNYTFDWTCSIRYFRAASSCTGQSICTKESCIMHVVSTERIDYWFYLLLDNWSPQPPPMRRTTELYASVSLPKFLCRRGYRCERPFNINGEKDNPRAPHMPTGVTESPVATTKIKMSTTASHNQSRFGPLRGRFQIRGFRWTSTIMRRVKTRDNKRLTMYCRYIKLSLFSSLLPVAAAPSPSVVVVVSASTFKLYNNDVVTGIKVMVIIQRTLSPESVLVKKRRPRNNFSCVFQKLAITKN